MLIPRYFFFDDFTIFYQYFFSQPHTKCTFKPNEFLWLAEDNLSKIYYIISGIAQTYIEHEQGYKKIISFHGNNTVFPGYHKENFKLEKSISTVAITKVDAIAFSTTDFHNMMENNRQLNAQVIEWYAMYVNLMLYEIAHQKYNNSFIKLCNLLYLLSQNKFSSQQNTISLTQEEIANILGINRVNLSKSFARLRNEHIIITHRKSIEIINLKSLLKYCSQETFKHSIE